MPTVNMREAKSSLSRLVEAVETGAETEIFINPNGRPAARLVSIKPSPDRQADRSRQGQVRRPDTTDADEAAITALFTGNAG